MKYLIFLILFAASFYLGKHTGGAESPPPVKPVVEVIPSPTPQDPVVVPSPAASPVAEPAVPVQSSQVIDKNWKGLADFEQNCKEREKDNQQYCNQEYYDYYTRLLNDSAMTPEQHSAIKDEMGKKVWVKCDLAAGTTVKCVSTQDSGSCVTLLKDCHEGALTLLNDFEGYSFANYVVSAKTAETSRSPGSITESPTETAEVTTTPSAVKPKPEHWDEGAIQNALFEIANAAARQ